MRLANRYCLLLIAALGCFLGRGAVVSALATPPAPGTRIESQAMVNYVDPFRYVSTDYYSNRVVTVVSGLPGIDLRSSQSTTQMAGGVFIFPHTLTNNGNVTTTFTLTPELVAGSLVIPEALALVADVNASGTIDVGEAILPFTQIEITLAPGQAYHFILTGRVPVLLPQAMGQTDTVTFNITARDTLTAASASNTDTLTVSRAPVITNGALLLTKSASSAVAQRGDRVTYRITGTNTTGTELEPRAVTVNGAQANYVIIRDAIPANMEFVEVLRSNGALPLYHYAGTPSSTYDTSPDKAGTVSAVAWAFPSLPGGFSFELEFSVQVGAQAGDAIHNVASGLFRVGAERFESESNVSTVTVPAAGPSIYYYRDNNYGLGGAPIQATRIHNDLFIEVSAGMCNLRSDEIDTIVVSITSEETKDTEVFTAVETGPNTGVFRITVPVPTQHRDQYPVAHGDGSLQTVANDKLIAEVMGGCGGARIATDILVDPYGVVYDSRTNAPVSGAQVTIINVATGAPATVYALDGSPAPSTVTTANDGRFDFPLVAPGSYRLAVVAPADYQFPSSIPAGMLPMGRVTLNPGSYGGNFTVGASVVVLDLPVDTTSGNGLELKKEASRTYAEVGDSVIYTLTLSNNSGAAFNYTHIDDYLPQGFRYEPGTTARDGVRIGDPQGGVGPHLKFNIGTLADGATTTFTYRVRLGPGAERGDGINTAQATAMGPPVLQSNKAYAQVRPRAGIFDPRGVIIGTVFVDANDNGVQDPGEPGVPGVRLILEDGTYAITDAQGKYSIYGQRAVTHVLKVDPFTLPKGAKLGGKDPSFAMDPNTRFVAMKNYELHKANFMLVEPTEELYAAIEERRKQAELWTPEFSRALDYSFNADANRQLPTDIESREAAGVVGGVQGMPRPFESVLPEGTLTHGNSSLPDSPVAPVAMVDLEDLVKNITEVQTGFIGLKDGDTLPYALETVRVVGHSQARLELLLNGQVAPESRVGKVVEQASPPLQAKEYVALRFEPGQNTLELISYDLFGNPRERETITVTAPDKMAEIKLAFSTLAPVADGMTPLVIDVQVVDKNGTPVTANLPLTLQSSRGRWDVEDMNKVEPGVQVFLENGRGTFRLIPPIDAGGDKIVISSGILKAEQRINYMPELRPMIAVGVLEGRVSLNRLSSNPLLGFTPDNAFEESLRQSAGIGSDGSASGRAAFYLKGKISEDTLLTVAYDSQKKRGQTELFRDIDPDAFFPVYGDDSIRGYDAQSSSGLYARIDYQRSYALLGDFNTRSNNEVRQLGDYNRSFNGVRLHYEESWAAGNFWITDDSSVQVIDTIPANGTSGPFYTNGGNMVLNSETVEIITRDRNQPSVILNTRTLARYTDYDFEPFSGRLLLNAPVPSMDANFNPQFIRITYELEHGSGKRFLTYGGSLQVKPAQWLEVGGAFVRDENPAEPYNLQSVNATVQLAENTYLIAEGARSDSFAEGVGYAGRVDLRHQSENTQARIFYGATEKTFDNPASTLNAGRIEGGLKVTHNIAVDTQVIAEGVYTEDIASTGNRKGVRIDLAHTLENQVKVTVGGRVSDETAAPVNPGISNNTEALKVRSLRLRIDTPVPYTPELSVFGEYEQDIFEMGQRVVAAGGYYQLSTRTRMYARHEFISSLGSPFELENGINNNNTLIGVESEYMQDGYVTNEYRVRNAIDGRQSEAAIGLRNLWNVSEGLKLNTTLERVTPFGSASTNESTAATLGFDYTRPETWKLTGRIEGRWGDTNDSYLNTFGYAQKVDTEWTVLARSIFNTQLAHGGGTGGGTPAPDLYQARFLTGMAWRQAEIDEWNALFRYEYKYEQGTSSLGTNVSGLQRQVHVLGTSVNYQPDAQWTFSGHYATKLVFESGGGYASSDYMAHIVASRVILAVSERWDIGLSLAATFSDRIENVQYAVGPEIGYAFHKNVRLGVGYNIVGFHDRDFDTAATSQGVFLTMRIKFDESLLEWARFD